MQISVCSTIGYFRRLTATLRLFGSLGSPGIFNVEIGALEHYSTFLPVSRALIEGNKLRKKTNGRVARRIRSPRFPGRGPKLIRLHLPTAVISVEDGALEYSHLR